MYFCIVLCNVLCIVLCIFCVLFCVFFVLFLVLCCLFPVFVQGDRPLPTGGNPTAVKK